MIKYSFNKLIEYCRLATLMIGLLIGVQVPSFVEQYGKSLESRLLESKRSMEEFQDDAERYFNGDVQRLIVHYESTADPVIKAGGGSIREVLSRSADLSTSLDRFDQSIYSPYLETFLNPHHDIRMAVWKSYTHTIVLKPDAIAFAVLTALCGIWVIDAVLGLLKVILWGGGALFGKLLRKPVQQPSNSL